MLTIQNLINDIHALQEDVETYERKYGVLSETVYELYENGEEVEDDAWVLDWGDWASAYRILLRRQAQYRAAMKQLQTETRSIIDIIAQTARHEPVPIPA